MCVNTCQLLKPLKRFGVHVQLDGVYCGLIVNLVVAIRESYAQCVTVQSASVLFTMGMATAVYDRIEQVQHSTAKYIIFL